MEWCELTILAGASSLSDVNNVIYSTSLKKKGNPKLIISESIKIDELRTLHDELMNIMPAPAATGQTLLRTLNKQIVFPTTYLLIYHLQSLPNPLENLSSIFLIVGILRSHVFSSQINMTPPFNPSPPSQPRVWRRSII